MATNYEIGAGFFKNADGTDGPGMAGFRQPPLKKIDPATGIRLGTLVRLSDGSGGMVVHIHWYNETARVSERPGVDLPWNTLAVIGQTVGCKLRGL